MSRQGEPMANTRRVQQQSIQHVLIHICTLQVFTQQTHTKRKAPLGSLFGSGRFLKLSTSDTSKLTGFPCVEIEGKGHPFLCRQGQGFSEVPQGPAAIFTAHLDARRQAITANRRSHYQFSILHLHRGLFPLTVSKPAMISGKSRCSFIASSTTLVITVRFTPLKHTPAKDCRSGSTALSYVTQTWENF